MLEVNKLQVYLRWVRDGPTTYCTYPKADGYEVWLSIKGNPKTFKVYGTSYKINLTGGKSKMAYKVKVRAWRKVNGKTIYGKWTTKKGKLK